GRTTVICRAAVVGGVTVGGGAVGGGAATIGGAGVVGAEGPLPGTGRGGRVVAGAHPGSITPRARIVVLSRSLARLSRSFDGHRLGGFAGLVDVQTRGRRQLAREDLERDHRQQRGELCARGGDTDHLVGVGLHVVVPLLGYHQGAGAAGADLLDVGDQLG